MKLKGQCLFDFETWYNKQKFRIPLTTVEYSGDGLGFYDLNVLFQYSAYNKFFNKVKLEMVTFIWRGKQTTSLYHIDDMKIGDQLGKDKSYKDISDAYDYIIQKAETYYNTNGLKYENPK